MNEFWYKLTGWILIIFGILISIGMVFFYTTSSIIFLDRNEVLPFYGDLIEGFGFLILTFILTFISSKYYLDIGNGKIKENKAIKVFVILSFFIFILPWILLIGQIGSSDIGLGILVIGGVSLIFLGIFSSITILFSIVNWFREKNKR